jgi:hypothetical protein
LLHYRRPVSDAGGLSMEDDADGQKDSAKKSLFAESFSDPGSSLEVIGGDQGRPQAKPERT